MQLGRAVCTLCWHRTSVSAAERHSKEGCGRASRTRAGSDRGRLGQARTEPAKGPGGGLEGDGMSPCPAAGSRCQPTVGGQSLVTGTRARRAHQSLRSRQNAVGPCPGEAAGGHVHTTGRKSSPRKGNRLQEEETLACPLPGEAAGLPRRTSRLQTTAPIACPRPPGAWTWLCRRRRSLATRRNL